MTTDSETLTDNGYLAIFQHLCQHRIEFECHRFMIGLLIRTTIIARRHDIEHAIVFSVLKRRIDAHVMSVSHEALTDLFFIQIRCFRQFRNRGMALVFLFEAVDFVIDFI